MDCKPVQLPYQQTGYFSKIIIDYLKGDEKLSPFYAHEVSVDGIKAAIAERKQFPTNRKLLVDQLQSQYAGVEPNEKVQQHIQQLHGENTFTITTAHQPNIFTGHLYFVYKILHAIKLAAELKQHLPELNFVPVFYMGSEDADLDELGHIFLFGERYEWKTTQKGAVGRMKVDKALLQLMDSISGQLLVFQFGKEIIELLKACYVEGSTIETATFKLINSLFGDYGLVVLLPDNATLKRSFIPIVEKEFATGFSHNAVQETVKSFPPEYKVQAAGREINLFYLKDDLRERIEEIDPGRFRVHGSDIVFDDQSLKDEIDKYPERFSANVILRPLYQEMILPNIAFIGGGGEIAYWLELKKVFDDVSIPFPVLVLRNSFLIVDKDQLDKISKLGFDVVDMFKKNEALLKALVERDTTVQLKLDNEKISLSDLYSKIDQIANAVDVTLKRHVESLQKRAIEKLTTLEKKMLKAEKKKFEAQQRQLQKLRTQLFPNNGLQERTENLLPYYAKWGTGFIRSVHENSLALQQVLVILTVG